MSWWSCRSCFVEGAGLARTSRRSDRTGTGPLARLLLGHFHQRCVHKASPARPTDHLQGNPQVPAVHSGQTGRENVTIQHPCRYRSLARHLSLGAASVHYAWMDATDRAQVADERERAVQALELVRGDLTATLPDVVR